MKINPLNKNIFSNKIDDTFNVFYIFGNNLGLIDICYSKLKKNLKVDVEIDGGINFENCSKVKDAGANIIVSGSTIFKENKGNLKKNIEILRNN